MDQDLIDIGKEVDALLAEPKRIIDFQIEYGAINA